MSRRATIAFLALALALPSFAAAQQFSRYGIFGCNQDGAYAMSVGSLSAVGGVYVPVNDAAVTLNTGYLVYKECILRGVVNRQREAVTAEYVRKIMIDFTTGRDGNPLWSVNLAAEERLVRDQSYLKSFQNGTLDTLNNAFASVVKRAMVQNYSQSVNAANKRFECGYAGDLNAAYAGKDFSWELMGHLMNPACNPYYAYELANEHVASVAQYDVDVLRTRLEWGGGIYDRVQFDQFGDPYVVTPASLVGGTAEYALLSGYRQQENANDIDQMVGALFGGMSAQVIGDNRGLAGLMQQTGSQASYLDQIVREAVTGLRTTASNAVLVTLNTKIVLEEQLRAIYRQMLAVMQNAAGDLRRSEAQCWNLIIEKVCTGALDSQKRCTASGGERLRVATSTEFSKAAIQRLLGESVENVEQQIENVDKAIENLNTLRAGVMNTGTPSAQQVAIQQFQTLLNQGVLHDQADVTAANTQLEAVRSRLGGEGSVFSDILTEWTTHDNPNVGWCKIDSGDVIKKWTEEWKI